MPASGVSLDRQLAEQNAIEMWVDCNYRSRPRPHSWRASHTVENATYHQCRTCPVSTRSLGGDAPATWLHRPERNRV